jgi:hypothetical protein
MATPKRPDHPRRRSDEEGRRYPDPAGRDRAVIIQILKKRIAGGPVPTAEMYAKALAQWQRLPGALMREPGTVAQTQKALSSDSDGKSGR